MDLVTGGSGFVGRHLVAELASRGDDVRVYDRRPLAATLDVVADRHFAAGSVEAVLGDVLDAHALREAMSGCRRVFHLAADPHLWHPDRGHFDRVNHLGTRTVLRVAREVGVELVVYTSTDAVLVPRRARERVDERVELQIEDMAGPYCRSKFLAERAAQQAAAAGLPVVIVNPAMPIGPGDRTLTPPTRMLVDFLSGRMPAYLDACLTWVDVRDAAVGHVLAAERGVPGRRHLLLGGSITTAAFFATLSKVSERPPPRIRVPHGVALAAAWAEEILGRWTGRQPRAPLTGVRLAGRRGELDGTWTRTRLGFEPRPLSESLADAVQWLTAEGLVNG